jgi:hypothetical protein
MDLDANIQSIRARMTEASKRSAFGPKDIEIVAVTKGHSAEQIQKLYERGFRFFGENKIQEAQTKIPVLSPDIRWAMIGHLQTNKVKDAVALFSMIQSVDSLRLAEKIDKECVAIGKVMPVLLEVNISGEEQKYGFQPREIASVFEGLRELKNIRVEGFMGMAVLTQDKTSQRKCFS